MTTQYDAYRKTTIDTSNNVRIVSLLFDGAINFLKVARTKMEQHDIAGKGVYLGKTTAIVSELLKALNMEEGGEIAENLQRLYDFVLDRLLQANLKNDLQSLYEAERVLDDIRCGWKDMERNQIAAAAACPASSPVRASHGAGMGVQA
ncbi:MAG: flagellar export chaperone FliS [Syntrophorhabdaceae bacterium]|nr:flagellar export chaperone FliS [Syntrophorhabdaceae bacterium]